MGRVRAVKCGGIACGISMLFGGHLYRVNIMASFRWRRAANIGARAINEPDSPRPIM